MCVLGSITNLFLFIDRQLSCTTTLDLKVYNGCSIKCLLCSTLHRNIEWPGYGLGFLNLNLKDYVEVPRSLVLYDVGGLR